MLNVSIPHKSFDVMNSYALLLIDQERNLIISQGKIEFQNINFTYSTNKVLQDINLIIPAGKKIAIVGLSGSGKSTIINLILRFFDPSKGKILIDNQDISLFSLNSLRQNISLVTQETTLFNDTIESNINEYLRNYSESYAFLFSSREKIKETEAERIRKNLISELYKKVNQISFSDNFREIRTKFQQD